MRKIYLFTTLFFLFGTFPTHAKIFWVTSNGNSGSGTLRQAILDANSQVGPDSILFDIPSSSPASRTITLTSLLPDLTDMVYIDATSQSAGAVFGQSTAKIQITSSPALAHCFSVVADSCKIFGFYINNFVTGIKINAVYVQIGAYAKGNTLFKCTDANILIFNTDHVAIVGNVIGLDTSLIAAPGNIGDGIRVVNSYAVSIGGKTFLTRNTIAGNDKGIHFVESEHSDVSGNYIGTNPGGTLKIPNKFGIYGSGLNSNIEIGGDTLHERNIISGNLEEGIYGVFTYGTIQANFIGTDSSGTQNLGNGGRGIYLLGGSVYNLIGGDEPDVGNVIAYNGKAAISFQNSSCSNNTVRRNSVFCNSQTAGNGGFDFKNGNENLVPPSLDIVSSSGVTGSTYANGIVDLYTDDNCSYCEGKTYIATVTAGVNGVFSYTGPLSGTITATVTNANGSTSRFATCAVVAPGACLIAAIQAPTAACTGTAVNFLDASLTEPGTSVVSWAWNFGDGSTSSDQNPLKTYSSSGNYQVTLVVTNSIGCVDTATKFVSVGNSPTALFSAPAVVCALNNIQFTDLSTAGSGSTLSSWLWTFGDGGTSTLKNPVYQYTSAGVYSVSLQVTASNGCTSSYSQSMTVYAAPLAGFTFVSAGLQVTFTNTSTTGGTASYLWDFGDGTVSTLVNPVKTYLSYGVYNVCLTVFDLSCGGSNTYCTVVDLAVGLISPEAVPMLVFPNPVQDVVYIQPDPMKKFNKMLITDMRNAVICSFVIGDNGHEDLLSLQLQPLPAGVYTIRFYDQDRCIGIAPFVKR